MIARDRMIIHIVIPSSIEARLRAKGSPTIGKKQKKWAQITRALIPPFARDIKTPSITEELVQKRGEGMLDWERMIDSNDIK